MDEKMMDRQVRKGMIDAVSGPGLGLDLPSGLTKWRSSAFDFENLLIFWILSFRLYHPVLSRCQD